MAKTAARQPEPGSIEERLLGFAEQVGWIAGFAKAKSDEILDRARLTDELTRIRDQASALLGHLQTQSMPASTPTPPARAAAKVRAPGKRHRAPLPRQRGVKHSHQEIAKAKMSSTLRRRGRG